VAVVTEALCPFSSTTALQDRLDRQTRRLRARKSLIVNGFSLCPVLAFFRSASPLRLGAVFGLAKKQNVKNNAM
jgi:hypothetical protein